MKKASGTERCVIKQQKRKAASSVELNVFVNQKGSMKVPSIGFTDQDLGSRVGSVNFST